MKIIKIIINGLASVALFSATFAAPAFANTSAPVVGNWAIHDHGQGCWGGGNLRADGTGDGGGACSISTPNGQVVADLDPVSWSFTDASDTAVSLCANITVKKGPADFFGPQPSCVTVPVNTKEPVNLPSISQDTYGKVTIHP